jgi:membrane protein
MLQPMRSFIFRTKERIFSLFLVRFVITVMNEMSKDNGSTMAAGIAYYGFLAIFPLLLGLIGLLGYFLPSQNIQQQIISYVDQNLPGISDVITSNIQNVINARGALTIIGIIGFLWSASGIFGALDNVINRARGITRLRPFFIRKPRDIGLIIGLGLLFLLSMGASYIFSIIPISSLPIVGGYAVEIGTRIVSFILIFIVILILFKIIPNVKTYWRHIWPGAFITSVLFEIGRGVFVYFSTHFTNYSSVYGAIGSIIAILVLIYYLSTILIVGVELTHEFSRIRRGENETHYILYSSGIPTGSSKS